MAARPRPLLVRALRSAAIASAAVVATLAPAAPAPAADPGRWRETGVSTVPLYYYQGLASDPQGNVFFDGIHVGLYRTDANLHETARNDDVFPPEVHLREGYNHIGDIAWDAREGGRVLLPVECYYPQAAVGSPDPHNTCRTGSIGVADPVTLRWRYYVKLDPAEIPKAMWVAVSPDGELLWTQSGNDLLAYRAADVNPANAAPAGPVIRAVRRVANARPPTGITGAAFYRGRLYMAGQSDSLFQVWSIDLDTGERRLEIEKQVVGESEGLDFFTGFGGVLHWLIGPYNTETVPTYGIANSALLHFAPVVPRADPPRGRRRGGMRLSVSPRQVAVNRLTRFRFRASAVLDGARRPVPDAVVRFAGSRARTDSRGAATVVKRLRRPGRVVARVRKDSVGSGRASVRVVRRPAS